MSSPQSPGQQGGRPKQSRIVVNVYDEKQQPGGRGAGAFGRMPRRRRMLLVAGAVFVAVVLAVLVGGFMWWRSYQSSPGYALALFVDAARRDDKQTIDATIDAERVAQSLAPQVIDKALASAGGMGMLAAPRRQIEAALPNLMPYARDQVRDEIARGVKEATADTVGDVPFFVLALAVPRAAEEIKQEGDTANVVFKKGENATTELAMKREGGDGGRWKIVGIKDDALASNIAARVVGSLTSQTGAALQGLNNQTRRPRTRRGRR